MVSKERLACVGDAKVELIHQFYQRLFTRYNNALKAGIEKMCS